MTTAASSFNRDANGVPITTTGLQATKTIAFDGGAGTGAAGTVTLFTVTGKVAVNVYGFCTEDLASAGGGTLELGFASQTATLADQQLATAIDNHEVWHEGLIAIGALVAFHFHPTDQDVILTIGTADVTNGTIEFYCNWVPISSNGDLVAA